MKIVFLDIDGVLNHIEMAYIDHRFPSIDPKAMDRLNMIINETGAKVVISSTWRKRHSVRTFQQLFNSKGFTGEVIDRTPSEQTGSRNGAPSMPYGPRGDQIQAWLSFEKGVEAFVILDDDSDMSEVSDRLVQTSYSTGLLNQHVSDAVSMLNTNVITKVS